MNIIDNFLQEWGIVVLLSFLAICFIGLPSYLNYLIKQSDKEMEEYERQQKLKKQEKGGK